MQQAVCYVEIKKKFQGSATRKIQPFPFIYCFYYITTAKKMKAPKSKALKHILNLTD